MSKFLGLALLVWLCAAAPLLSADLNVFAAASLSDALTDIGKSYEQQIGAHVRFNFAASSTLARQIKAGAPADIFFSADEAKMDDLAAANLLVPGTRRSVLSNRLVLVTTPERATTIKAPDDLAKNVVARIALAQPDTVPAGIYAKKFLQEHGLWSRVSGKIIQTENVRACLAAVASGDADAGFVYKTDAMISPRVIVVYTAPADEKPEISYSLAVIQSSRHIADAKKFADYLTSDAARAVFTRYGFISLGDK